MPTNMFPLFLCLLAGLAWAQDGPKEFPFNVQVDIIFPRHGGRYKPIFPFPIVLAIHNLTQAWHYEFHLRYSISAASRGEGGPSEVEWPIFERDALPTGPLTTVPVPAGEPFLFINSTDEFGPFRHGSPVGEYGMFTELFMITNCTDPEDEPLSDAEISESRRFTGGAINFGAGPFFTIAEDGEMPFADMDGGGEGPCGVGSAAMTIAGERLYDAEPVKKDDGAALAGTQCPIMAGADAYPDPKEGCLYRMTAEDRKAVTEEMLRASGCAGRKGVSWPSEELTEPCEEGASTINRPGLMVLAAAIAFAGFNMAL